MSSQRFIPLGMSYIFPTILMLMPSVIFIDVYTFLMSFVIFISALNVYVYSRKFYFAFFNLLSLLGQGMQMSPLITMLLRLIALLNVNLLILDMLFFVICLVFLVHLLALFPIDILLLAFFATFKYPQMNRHLRLPRHSEKILFIVWDLLGGMVLR